MQTFVVPSSASSFSPSKQRGTAGRIPFIALLIFGIPSADLAQTYVNRFPRTNPDGYDVAARSYNEGSTVWGMDGSPYIVEGNVAVGEGAFLTIETGVEIRIRSNEHITVNGTLNANDAAFTVEGEGQWGGFYLGPEAGGSSISDCDISGTGAAMGYFRGATRYAAIFVDGCDPNITGNLFSNLASHGVELYFSNAEIRNNVFSNIGADGWDILIRSLEDRFPEMGGNSGTGTGVHKAWVSNGSITGRMTWNNPGIPYFVSDHISIGQADYPDAVLTVESGTRVLFNMGGFSVHTSLQVEGTDEEPAEFLADATDAGPGSWKGIYIGPEATASYLNHCLIQHAGSGLGYFQGATRYTAVYVDGSSPVFRNVTIAGSGNSGLESHGSNFIMENCRFEGNLGHAIMLHSGDRPMLTEVIFENNGANGRYPIYQNADCDPEVGGLLFSDNAQTGVQVIGGTIVADAYWESWASNAPYIVTADVFLSADTSLSIEPGTTIKLANSRLHVEGTLISDGSANEIVWTSDKDDRFGGDSNGDGGASVPESGDWKGIYLGPAAGGSILTNNHLAYTGAALGYFQAVTRYANVFVDSCDPIINGNRFESSAAHGVELWSSSGELWNNAFSNIGADGWDILYRTLDCFPATGGNEGFGEGNHKVWITGGGMNAGGTWMNPGIPLYLSNGINIGAADDPNAALTIEPGTRVQIRDAGLYVFATLEARGTEDQPILFESASEEPAPGNWKGLYFGPNAGQSVLEHCVIQHGGNAIGYYHGTTRYTSVYVDQSAPVFRFVQFLDSANSGLEAHGANLTIEDCLFAGSAHHAVMLFDHSNPILSGLVFENNGLNGRYTVYMESTCDPQTEGLAFNGNAQQGIQVGGGVIGGDAYWEIWADNAPYVVTGDLTIPTDATLEIQPGAVVKLANAGIHVHGTLISDGEMNPIVWTSDQDDRFGGDSNGDGDTNPPEAGNWKGFYISPTSSGTVIRDNRIAYSGAALAYLNGLTRYASVYVAESEPLLTGNRFENGVNIGVELWSCSPEIRDNLFSDLSGYSIVLRTLDCYPIMSGNSAMGTGNHSVWVVGGTLTTNGLWTNPGLPYYISDDIAIGNGDNPEATLRIALGSRLMFNSGRKLIVNATLIAEGAAEEPIGFLSALANPAPGDWGGVYFGPNAGRSILSHCELRHGGGSLGYIRGATRYGAMMADGSAPDLSRLRLHDNANAGVILAHTNGGVSNSLVSHSGTHGVYVFGPGQPFLLNNTLTGGGAAAVRVDEGTPLIANNVIAFNSGESVVVPPGRQDFVSLDAVRHNLAFGNTANFTGPNGVEADPLFLDASNGGFQLSAGSDAIDAGDTALINPMSADLGGRIRLHGAAVDMGAYEFGAPLISYGLDLAARAAGEESWSGEGLLAPTEQIVQQGIPAGGAARYDLKLRYLGNLPDSLTLNMTMPPQGWNGVAELIGETTEDVTASLLSGEGLLIEEAQPGQEWEFALQVTPLDSDSAGECQLTFTAQSARGESDELHVSTVVSSAPRIVEEPSDRIVNLNETLTLDVLAEGPGPFTYVWKKDGEIIPDAEDRVLVIAFAALKDAGAYTVEVGNDFGAAVSRTAVVEVIEAGIAIQPSSQEANEFDAVLFSVSTADSGPFTYQWFHGETALCGENGPDLFLPSVRTPQAGTYRVEAANAEGEVLRSEPASLAVIPSGIADVELYYNGNVLAVFNQPAQPTIIELEETAFVTRLETYHWNNAQGSEPGTIALEDAEGNIYGPWQSYGRCGQGGVPNAYWMVFPLADLPPGAYTVLDSDPSTWSQNGASNGQGFAWLWGAAAADIEIVEHPRGLSLASGEVAIFQVRAQSESPLEYQWRKDGAPLTNGSRIAGADGPLLSIHPVSIDDAGHYSVAVSNPTETLESEPARLLVDRALPIIVQQPNDVAATEGDSISLEVRVQSPEDDPPVYQWNRNGDPLFEDGRISGVQSAVLTLSPIAIADAGLYQVRVSNSAGSVLSRFASVEFPVSTSLGESLGWTAPWVSSGSASWFAQSQVTHDGVSALQSGNIDHGEFTSIGTTLYRPGVLSFFWKVSSESADPLSFYLDTHWIAGQGGDHDWSQWTQPIRWGEHSVEWRYSKDGSIDSLSDAGWLDEVRFEAIGLYSVEEALPDIPLPIAHAGPAPWFGQDAVTYEGAPAAQTGNADHNQSSSISIEVSGPGVIEFAWKADCEGADPLKFLDNGILRSHIEGDRDWERVDLDLRWGRHVLTWEYDKDGSVHSGRDAAWLADVRYRPFALSDLAAAVQNNDLSFTTTGPRPWFGQGEVTGGHPFAAQAGDISHGQSSSLNASVEGPGTISWRWKVSSEGADPLRFLIDGNEQARISGELDWQVQSFAVEGGSHAVEWTYSKDGSVAHGLDAGFVDRVRFTPGGTGVSTADGDWASHHELLVNSDEAALMVRVGDIDNLGFGWPAGFDPFSGNTTPSHGFPWVIDPLDPAGTDRIMVVSSYQGSPPAGSDGYTSNTSRPANEVQPIVLDYELGNIEVGSAVLQMFVDDFQAPVWGANYTAYINDVRASFLEDVINELSQTGPVGKLITANVPDTLFDQLRTGRLEILIDDTTTGAGDGFAIDFVKLLINPGQLQQVGTITGVVDDAATGNPLSGIEVSASGIVNASTDADGRYRLDNVPAGLVVVRAGSGGYEYQSKTADLIGGAEAVLNFELNASAPSIVLTIHRLTGGQIEILWEGGTPPFNLEYKNALNDPEWILLLNETMERSVTMDAPDPARFFRVAEAR